MTALLPARTAAPRLRIISRRKPNRRPEATIYRPTDGEVAALAYLADPEKIGWRAYKKVYPKSSQHAAETAFSRLLKNAEFSARVAEIVKRYAAAAGLDPAIFSGHSLRAGFVTSALEHGADVLKVMDVTRHKRVDTLKGYDRRARAFKNHAGKDFL